MAKKADSFYFNNFIQCAECSCRAARFLSDTINNFNPEQLSLQMEVIHGIENEGDTIKHTLIETLSHAFITPIEREDITEISRNLDDLTDTIEDVVLRLYMCNVQTIRPEAIQFVDLIVKACDLVKVSMEELVDFKKSKKIKEYKIQINNLEEEGDRLYIESMRKLHTTVADPLEVLAWRDVLNYLERCLDTCEDIGDILEDTVLKNS